MSRILSLLLCVLLVTLGLLSCACAGERDVVGYYDFLADVLADTYQEPTIVSGNGLGPWDGRPDDDMGVYAVCILDRQNTYYLSIFEKETNDEKYVLSGELKDISFRGILPTNLFVEFFEAHSSKEYRLTYGYEMDETYIQIECHSLTGSKEWKIKSFSVRDENAENYGFIDFAPNGGGFAVYTNVPIREHYKNDTASYFCGDTDTVLPTDFNELNIDRLFSFLCSMPL